MRSPDPDRSGTCARPPVVPRKHPTPPSGSPESGAKLTGSQAFDLAFFSEDESSAVLVRSLVDSPLKQLRRV